MPSRTAPNLLSDSSGKHPGGGSPLSEPSLFYDPPYATPLHDALAWHLVKYLAPALGLRSHPRPESSIPLPTADFLVESGRRRVALILTDSTSNDTEWHRDALWIGEGHADAVLRFRIADLEHRLPDALYLWTRWMPALFSERGRTNLSTLASPVACQPPRSSNRTVTLRYADSRAHLCTLLDVASLPPDTLVVRRLLRQRPDVWRPAFERARSASSHRPAPRRTAA